MPPRQPHFEIDASIVFQLGEDLITDAVQALVELVKNCYDADAEFAKVTVATGSHPLEPRSLFPEASGFILVEDNGSGMDESVIRDGWLTISKSLKRELKSRLGTTPLKGRVPLGDKGLGRLGVQRLGFNVEIFTRPRGSDVIYHVGWSWKDFLNRTTLSQVIVKWKEYPAERWKGTRLLISELREPEYWAGEKQFEQFELKLSQLVSPYRNFQDFRVLGSVNGKDLELSEISEKVRSLSQLRYQIKFDGQSLRIKGRARLGYMRPNSRKEADIFDQLVASDNGEKLFAFLDTSAKARDYSLTRSRGHGWFVEYSARRQLSEIDGVEGGPEGIASPGPFEGEIDSFDLGGSSADDQSIYNRASDYRKHIKALSGVRIFRDGFGVRTDTDWLGLGKQWTTGTSYYGLKPQNTLGFVALSARDNRDLVETTDREGFKDTPHFRNFLRLFDYFVEFTHKSQEFLRRGWTDFRNRHQEEVAAVDAATTPEELVAAVADGLEKVTSSTQSVKQFQGAIREAQADTKYSVAQLQKLARANPEITERLNKFKEEIGSQLDDLRASADALSAGLANVASLRETTLVVQNHLGQLQGRLDEMYEAVSLGLTAEALSHEIGNIVDQLAERTKTARQILLRDAPGNTKLLTFVEYVSSSTAALRKQLSHLAPSLKYVREKRQPIPMGEFLERLKEYHESRWQDTPIQMKIAVDGDGFTVRMNEGKLTQILDNLILNSDYWLREEFRRKKADKGTISLRVKAPYLIVSDSGPGVDQSIENTLFEPFVTLKARGRGRGLGLFIVSQLLDSEGCTIALGGRRNNEGRLNHFQIDFSGAIEGHESSAK